jgi:hypothetical protein
MAAEFESIFELLKPILAKHAKRLVVKDDKPGEYMLVTKSPSPFPQHKGEPMFFGAVRTGKAYVSFHLMPIYMCPELIKLITPGLKKRMQGKSCFNFKTAPEADQLADLKQLTAASVEQWKDRKWL